MDAFVALYRLARAHGHEWTHYVTEDDCSLNWEEAIARADRELLHDNPSFPAPTAPSLFHTTATGRLHWQFQHRQGITLTVNRPGLIPGSNREVVRVDLTFREDECRCCYRVDATPKDGVQLRHLVTAERAVRAVLWMDSPDEDCVAGALERVRQVVEGDCQGDCEGDCEGDCPDRFYGGSPMDCYQRLLGEVATIEATGPYSPFKRAGY